MEKNMFKSKLFILSKELITLKIEFSILKILDKEKSLIYGRYGNFFIIIINSINEVTILRMSKIIVDNKDSLNLFNLINFIDDGNNLKRITNNNKGKIKEIKNQNNIFRKELEEFKKMVKAINDYRDKGGAHIDKQLANKNKTIKIRLNLNEFEKIIEEIEKIFNYYWEKIVGGGFSALDEESAADQLKEIIRNLPK